MAPAVDCVCLALTRRREHSTLGVARQAASRQAASRQKASAPGVTRGVKSVHHPLATREGRVGVSELPTLSGVFCTCATEARRAANKAIGCQPPCAPFHSYWVPSLSWPDSSGEETSKRLEAEAPRTRHRPITDYHAVKGALRFPSGASGKGRRGHLQPLTGRSAIM